MNRYQNEIEILYYIEGAKKAKGLTVIIDVFRAFSLECYLYEMGVKGIRPVEGIDEAFSLSSIVNDSVLIGERRGKKIEGFAYGNSPSTVELSGVKNKIIIHTTSAGTQGIANALEATEIITGSLVNAKAVAEYILEKNPPKVSLVCMGNNGVSPAPEDELCAFYIRSLLRGKEMEDLDDKIQNLRFHGGEHFFDETTQDVFPKEDFALCIKRDQFPFIIKVEKDELGFYTKRINRNGR